MARTSKTSTTSTKTTKTTKTATTVFPLNRLPFDLLENVLSFLIKHEDTQVFGVELLYVNRNFARAVVPHIWNHIFIVEPTQYHLSTILKSPIEKLMFNYPAMIRSVKICPVSISDMKPGGLLRSLKILSDQLPNLKRLHIEDKLSFCHVCLVGKEATTIQVAALISSMKKLKELNIDSNHDIFNDSLLAFIAPTMTDNLTRISLSGGHFTDKGIVETIIPALKHKLVEISAGLGGINPVSITGSTVISLLTECTQLRRMSLEGLHLHDKDFLIEDLPENKLEYLYLGKVSPQDFTTFGLRSLLLTCHKSLITLKLDLDHISQIVIQDIIIPLFQNQKLSQFHLVSDSWAAWAAHYPRPRYEHELRAKEAMWRWKMKAYWGLSNDSIQMIGKQKYQKNVRESSGVRQIRGEARKIE
ncbi:hypothetical protein G9A89_002646 [Geosiphon pyriformis]|nr:hypothetical protein G9A89_002646 [Geosiphon pyriformis]